MRNTWSTTNDILSRIDGNEILTDKQTIANNFNSYFTNIGPNMACNITNTNDSDFSHYLKEKLDINFAMLMRVKLSKSLTIFPQKYSSGKDQISTNLLKQIKHCITPSLTLLINQMLNTGIFPDNFKIAKVIPLSKKVMTSLSVITAPYLFYLLFQKFLKKLYIIKFIVILIVIIFFTSASTVLEKISRRN